MNSSSAPALTNNVLKEPPPGPRGHPLFGNLIALSTSTIEAMARCTREDGNVVRFRMPWPMSEVVLINEPRLIKRVLVDDADAFRKGVKQRRGATVLGRGLLLAEGEPW